MRILITGGAGFLGSHLSRYMLAKGHKIIALDNFSTGSAENIKDLFGNPDFEFIKYDVTNYINISGNLDAIMHFASPASPIDYLKIPIETLKVGSIGTHKALGVARAKGARFLMASTSEVYGDPLINPQPESYWGNVNPIGPRGVYDEAKRFSEALVMAYHKYKNVDTKIVRIFNTFGPDMRINDGRAVPTFMTQALTNKPITVFGTGKQTRSLCYVSDLVEGIYRLLMSEEHEPVNIGNPQEITLLELAEMIKKLAGSSSEIVYMPLPTDDPKVRRPDTSKAEKLLNWKAEVPLEQGLRKTMEYFRKKLGLK
ncbi:MAG: SDR family oxidoreductase [Elusimicrobiales bacterium]|nr:SDR family oxidoreductase [Elusimicrobiales bacterium]